jgi:hypothetical protein
MRVAGVSSARLALRALERLDPAGDAVIVAARMKQLPPGF